MVKLLLIGAIAFAPTLLAAPLADTTPASETFTTAQHAAGTAFDWVVPDGVTQLSVTATGGNGGTANSARPGGRGAVVTVPLTVEPGSTLHITLGADGTLETGGAGYGAGGTGIASGGGGGSTAIVVDGEVLVVAGAGGGSSDTSSEGGGGAGGTPDGQAGSRRGGSGGAGGEGGIGVAPWGGPGGASYLGSGGTVNGTEAGSGGGAGDGGGGAGGARGDGGGGGSFSAAEGATYSTRLDDLVDGWVQLDYVPLVAEPTPEPTAADPTSDPQTILGIPFSTIGIAAAVIVVLSIGLLIVRQRVRS